MSVWTHVCGCIRVDSLRLSPEHSSKQKEKVREALGNIVEYGEDADKTTIPCGSEGSLEYEILENPDECSIAAFVVPVWGDLRDYDDADAIKEWFESVLVNLWVRNAVITIEVEYGKSITYSYTYEDVENLKKQ